MASSLRMQLYNYLSSMGQNESAERQANSMRHEAFIRSAQPGSLSHLPYGVAAAVQNLQFIKETFGSESFEYLTKLHKLGEVLEAHGMIKEAHDTYLDCIGLIERLGYSDSNPLNINILCQAGLERTKSS